MKKLLVTTVVALFSVSAFATKARLTALGNARHLLDTQSLWNNPSDVYASGDWISAEFGNNTDTYGAATTAASPKAEGGFVQTFSFGKLGVFFGHRSDSSSQLITAANGVVLSPGTNTTDVPLEQNPLDLLWAKEIGGMKTAFGLHYSNSKSDSLAAINNSSVKQNTLGGYAGVRGDIWDAYLRFGLAGSSKNETANTELKAEGYFRVGGRYAVDTITYFADVTSAKAKTVGAADDAKADVMTINVGMVNNHKLDSGNFFYGLSYLSDSQELKQNTAGTRKNTISALPLVVGMEVDANSWLVLRGSIAQAFFVGDKKTEFGTATPGKTANINDTTVNAGVGMKWNKFLVDGTLSAAGSAGGGAINSANLLANAAVTYLF